MSTFMGEVKCGLCGYGYAPGTPHDCLGRDRYNPAQDPVNNPEHYRQGEIECVDGCRSSLTDEEFRGSCKAQAMQYIWRERLKGGDLDLKKAIWWLRMAVGDDPRA